MISIRKANSNDIDSLMEIENTCFINPWSKEDLIREISENIYANFLLAEIDGVIAGFIDCWFTFESGTICQIGVLPNFRRNHIASTLMEKIIELAKFGDVYSLTLEVRASNVNAIGLYKKFQFEQRVIKPHYYENGEDAIYMVRSVY